MPSLFPADPPGHHADALPADTGHAVTRGLHRLLRTRHAFWKLFVPLVLLMLGTGLFSLQQLHLATQSRFYSLQQLAVDNREAQLQEAFDAYLNLLRGINQDVALRRYIQTPSAMGRQQAEESLYSAIQTKAQLTQLRWIDESGMERLRINQGRHVVTVVPPGQLQYKGDRYYFKDTMALGPNEVYVSPLDLNVENGEIEYPVVPTLRLALQVQDEAQQPRGILIVNVDASAWLDQLPRQNVWEEHSQLLNAEGYWLRASNAADEWGFMLPHKASFAQRHPQVWQHMQAAPDGSHLDANGHWIWRRLNFRADSAPLPVGQAPVLIQVSMLPNTAAQQVLLGMALYILPVMAISLGLLGYVLHWLVRRSQHLWRLSEQLAHATRQAQVSQRALERSNRAADIGLWSLDTGSGVLTLSPPLQQELQALLGNAGSVTWDVLLHDIACDEQRAQLQQAVQDVQRDGGQFDLELELQPRQSGAYGWYRMVGYADTQPQAGTGACIEGTLQNISPGKQRERVLQQERQRLASIIDGTRIGTWEWNVQTGSLEMNAIAWELLGYRPHELESFNIESWKHLTHPDDLAYGTSLLAQHFVNADVHYRHEMRLRHKAGHWVWVLNSGSVMTRTASGAPWMMFGALTDLSELVASREAANAANEAKSAFLSSMSHELRTPLNAIMGFGQMLQYSGAALDAEQEDHVNEILKAGRHLLGLINEVLDLSKIESGQLDLSLEPVALHEVVQDCEWLIAAMAAERDITLELAVAEHWCVQADRMRLKQILLNLLSNAVKYNRPGGQVRISVQAQHGAEQGPQACISVIDTGNGISPEHQCQVFQPFNRLGAEGSNIEGTGIGLTICQRLATLMHGHISFESTVGMGSTFSVVLPLLAGGPEPGHTSTVTPPPAPTEAPRDGAGQRVRPRHSVLCVDDNPSNLKLMSHMLEQMPGVQVLQAHTPQLGIDLAQAYLPQLILLDINMPDMDGYKVLARLRTIESLRQVPIVAVTANALPKDVARGLAAGFEDYITKPLDVPVFIEKVRAWLAVPDASAAATPPPAATA